MDRKGNLAVFEGSSISETGEVTPTKNDMHGLGDLVYSTPLPPLPPNINKPLVQEITLQL